jgi:hypothetical protein
MYPSRFFYGCISHGLNLLVKSVLGPKAPPQNYPFGDLKEFTVKCIEVVKFFRNHAIFKVKLEERQAALKAVRLVMPGFTRWGSFLRMFKSLLASVEPLEAMVRDETPGPLQFLPTSGLKFDDRQQRVRIYNTVFNASPGSGNGFRNMLQKVLKILEPVDIMITYFQGNSIPISEAFKVWLDFDNQYRAMGEDVLTSAQKQYLLQLGTERQDFMYGKCHGLAYLLDPRYFGEGIKSISLIDKLEDEIAKFPESDVYIPRASGTEVSAPIASEEVQRRRYSQLTSFRVYAKEQKDKLTHRYKALVDKEHKQSVFSWWYTKGQEWPDLQDLALRLFSLPCTSCESERAFSALGFVHSKLRNRLSVKKADKTQYIRANTAILEDEKAESLDDDSDADFDDLNNDYIDNDVV